MFKRNTSIFVLIMFILTLLPFTSFQEVHAYTSNSYFNNLKVGLTSMSATSIKVTLNGDYTSNGQTYSSGSILNLGISGTSITVNGISQSDINLVPNSESNLLTITSGTVSNKYMGSFHIKVYNAKILPINTLYMENYLKGVVGYEMSDYFPIEALKAQAVAARNYALSKVGYENAKGYDFDDTIYYQVYKGYNASYTRVITAVEETKGQVLLYNDKLVETLYSAWHGGVSENSENVWGNIVPYLRSALDTFENDPWPSGNRVLTNAQIQSTLITKGLLSATDTFVKLDLDSITKFTSGRLSNINIIYENALGATLTKSVIRDNTRTFLSLPSNLYTVTYDSVSGAYTFSGKGYGHGLGMSQIGAKNRATAGQTYDQILKFYFQNTYLQSLILEANLSTLTQSSNAEINSFEANKAQYISGESINLNTIATLGSGSYLYKYVISNNGVILSTIDYNSSSSLQYVTTTTGTYSITVYLKDLLSNNEFDSQSTLSVTVYSPELSAITASGSFYEGKSLALNSSSTGTSTLGFSYKYEVYKNTTLVAASTFNASSEFSFIATASGIYTVNVYGKDGLSTNTYDSMKQFNITINSKPLYLSTLPLKLAMTSNDVASLQNALVTLGYNISDRLGYYGKQTKNQVTNFQKSKGLTKDGVVGNMTYNALNEALIQKSGTKTLTY